MVALLAAPSLAQQTASSDAGLEAELAAGRALVAASRWDEARPRLVRALELAVGDLRRELEILVLLTGAESALGEYVDAERRIARAEALLAEAPDPRLAARLANERATLLLYRGDSLGALAHRRQSVAAARSVGDTALLVPALLNLGQNLVLVHDYLEALLTFAEALDLPMAPPQRAIALASTGICHFELGQFDEAERSFRQAGEQAEAAGNAAVAAWAQGELGLTAWTRDRDGERARQLYEAAARGARAIGDVRNEATWMQNQAVLLREQGSFDAALELGREALAKLESMPGQRPSASLFKHLALCLLGLGRDGEGEAMLARAIEVARAAGDTKNLWETHRERGRLFASRGRRAEAEGEYRASLDAIESVRSSLRLEALKTDFFATKVGVYGELVALLWDEEDAAALGAALEVAERARARSFLDTLVESRARLHETLPPEVRAREEALLVEISQLQAAARRPAADPALPAQIRDREAELERLAIEVRSRFPRFRELQDPAPASLAQLQAVLGAGEAVVVYFVADEASRAWLVEEGSISGRLLPGRSELDARVRAAMAEVLDPAHRGPAISALSEVLLGAWRGRLGDRLFVVPAGILHHFPFDALTLDDGPLARRVATTYLPSATALLRLREGAPHAAPPRLLAVGDPDFDVAAASRRDAHLGIELVALPHTRREVEAVTALFGRRSSVAMLGPEATESGLKAQGLEVFSVIHLATHGALDSAHPARSALVLGREPAGGEDGILQMREIFRLRLDAELVTLSSCQSALGEVVSGEGVVGLARAFLYAGADAVVASLWNVEDEAAAALMARFYRELRRGASKSEALRRARVALADEPRYAHPHYWAAFVLVGRGDDGVRFPPSPLPAVAGVAAVGLAAVAALALAYRRRRPAAAAP